VQMDYERSIRLSRWLDVNITHSAKYQAPMTLAQVILNMPRATAQLHSHMLSVPAIAQFAYALTCHSKTDSLTLVE